MGRKRGNRASNARTGFEPLSKYLQRNAPTEYPSLHLISLPSEIRQRILLDSIDDTLLESKQATMECAAKLSRVNRVFGSDMVWVRKQWLIIWKQKQERYQHENVWIHNWIKESVTRIPQQYPARFNPTNLRPCKNCRRKWKNRGVSGIQPLCKNCKSRGVIWGWRGGWRSLQWGWQS